VDPAPLLTWLQLVAAVLGGLALLVGGLWAFTKYVVERGVLPPVELSIESRVVGIQDGQQIIEVLPQIRNVGTTTVIVTALSVRLLYLLRDDPVTVEVDAQTSRFGRVRFTRSVSKELSADQVKRMPITPHDTFVQPGVKQVYTVVTAVPDDATFLLLHCQFEYAQRPTKVQNLTVALSRRLGLIQYTLKHVSEPHTIEKCVAVGTVEVKPNQGLPPMPDGRPTGAAET